MYASFLGVYLHIIYIYMYLYIFHIYIYIWKNREIGYVFVGADKFKIWGQTGSLEIQANLLTSDFQMQRKNERYFGEVTVFT